MPAARATLACESRSGPTPAISPIELRRGEGPKPGSASRSGVVTSSAISLERVVSVSRGSGFVAGDPDAHAGGQPASDRAPDRVETSARGSSSSGQRSCRCQAAVARWRRTSSRCRQQAIIGRSARERRGPAPRGDRDASIDPIAPRPPAAHHRDRHRSPAIALKRRDMPAVLDRPHPLPAARPPQRPRRPARLSPPPPVPQRPRGPCECPPTRSSPSLRNPEPTADSLGVPAPIKSRRDLPDQRRATQQRVTNADT